MAANDVSKQWSCDRCREGFFTAVSQCSLFTQLSEGSQMRFGGEGEGGGGQKPWFEFLSFRLNLWAAMGVTLVLTILF